MKKLFLIATTVLTLQAYGANPCVKEAVSATVAQSVKDLNEGDITKYATKVTNVETLNVIQQVGQPLKYAYEITLETSADFPSDDESYKVNLDENCAVLGKLEKTNEL